MAEKRKVSKSKDCTKTQVHNEQLFYESLVKIAHNLWDELDAENHMGKNIFM